MNSITVKAPAKVNLFLKVLGKRKDSYHNIITVFERIALADTIRISKIPKGIIVKSDRPITRDPKDNLVFKAAEAILRRGRIKSGVKIDIKKRIPIASGLGGGSSDAASTMMGMNKLFKLKLDSKTLLTVGKRLGADVPFFLLDTPFAIGRGRGDVLKAVKSEVKFWHLIIKAGAKTATKDIYEAFDASVNSVSKAQGIPEPLSKYLTPRQGGVKMSSPSKLWMDYAQAEAMLHNDLERAVLLQKKAISRISASLTRLLGKKAIVSGSGPSLFWLYRTRREAAKARGLVLKIVPEHERSFWHIFVTDTCS